MAAIFIVGLIASAPAARVQKQNGQCTEADLQIMNAAGPGTHKGSFAHLIRDCGMATWSIYRPLNFDTSKYTQCAEKSIGLTTSCAGCWANYSSYGLGNCWKNCLNWCSKGCLTCVQKDLPTLESCIGATAPLPQACDSFGQEISRTTTTTIAEHLSYSTSQVAEGSDTGADETTTADTTTLAKDVAPTTTAVKFAGACSAADKELMDKAGPGYDEGSWAKTCANCGKSSFSVFRLSMDEKSFRQCVKGKVPVSESCAGCFAGSATYSAGACWSQCISFCSKGCLMCVNNYISKLESCIGFSPPAIWACDGTGYHPGVVHPDRSPDSDGNHSDGNGSILPSPPSTTLDKDFGPTTTAAGGNDLDGGNDLGTGSQISVSPYMVVVYSLVVATFAGVCGFCLAKRS